MSQEKKIEKLLEIASTEELEEYQKLLKIIKKRLPLIGRTKRIAAALLREHLGDISRLNLERTSGKSKTETGKIVFEDIKDGKARLFINLGKTQRINAGELIKEIVRRSGIDGKLIGKIDVHSTYSFFEVPEQHAEMVYYSFDDVKIRGMTVVVEPAKRRK